MSQGRTVAVDPTTSMAPDPLTVAGVPAPPVNFTETEHPAANEQTFATLKSRFAAGPTSSVHAFERGRKCVVAPEARCVSKFESPQR